MRSRSRPAAPSMKILGSPRARLHPAGCQPDRRRGRAYGSALRARSADRPQRGARPSEDLFAQRQTLTPDRRRLDLDFTGPVTWQAFNDGTKLAVTLPSPMNRYSKQLGKGPDPARPRLTPAGAAAPAAQSTKAAATAAAAEGHAAGRRASGLFRVSPSIGRRMCPTGSRNPAIRWIWSSAARRRSISTASPATCRRASMRSARCRAPTASPCACR